MAMANETHQLSPLSSVILALGLILGAWILGSEIRDIRVGDRYVSVRGLAERIVKSDLAIWPLRFREAGNDLKATFSQSEQDRQAVLDFLAHQGIPKSDITVGQPNVVDTEANEYAPGKHPYRFIVEQEVSVRSTNVDQVAAAVQRTSELIARGVVIGASNYGPGAGGVSYFFTGLNSIKPEMISEATHNARAAAERFAADADSKVGTIRRASQEPFSITSADDTSPPGQETGGDQSAGSMMKKVRVVTMVDFYLGK